MGNLTNSGKLINEIESKQDQLIAGHGIDITNNVISTTGGGVGGADWGNIGGTLSDQTDLQEALDSKQVTLIAGNGLNITEAKGRDPAKGPCPDGSHIPLNAEISNLMSMLSAIPAGSSISQKMGYIKMPFPGYIDAPDGVFYKGGVEGAYLSATPSTENLALVLEIKSNSIRIAPWRNATGLPIRPFNNIVVEPDSNWTEVYVGGTVMIYWDEVNGLISFSRDNGNSWITILDKNVGATTVWNYGDEVTAANCGSMFQWGNNYAFTWGEDAPNTSTETVDGTLYSYDNPFSSSTFRLSVGSAGYWAPLNYDIWGGQSASSKTEGTYIENSGVTSINGKFGQVNLRAGTDISISASGNNITINSTAVTKAATAPTAEAGAIWFDTDNGLLYVHNGTEWKQMAFA